MGLTKEINIFERLEGPQGQTCVFEMGSTSIAFWDGATGPYCFSAVIVYR